MDYNNIVSCTFTFFVICGMRNGTAEEPSAGNARDDNDSIVVHHSLSINRIVDLDIETQMLTIDAYEVWTWQNRGLARTLQLKEDSQASVTLPVSKIRLPDIVCFNCAGKQDKIHRKHVQIYSDGSLSYIPAATIQSNCPMKHHIEAGDHVTCKLVFGSWQKAVTEINIVTDGETVQTTEYTDFNRKWELVGSNATRIARTRICSPDLKFSAIQYEIELKRKHHID